MRSCRLENRIFKPQSLPACYALLCLAAGLFFAHTLAWGGIGLKSAVVVSQKIKPYLQVVEGIVKEAGQAPNEIKVFFLMPKNASGNQALMRDIENEEFGMVLAVGPEAASLVWTSPVTAGKMYTAVLDPRSVPGLDKDSCGISLRIPVEDQLNRITGTFPLFKKIGLLFDPANNQWFYDAAKEASMFTGVEILPLEISARGQISKVLDAQKMDAVWMIPDQTIISEKIVQFVIKEGIYRNIGVIGYNSFFIRSGAVFSFEFDYRELGQQAGQKLLSVGQGNDCLPEPPVFNTMVNPKIAGKIGLEVTP